MAYLEALRGDVSSGGSQSILPSVTRTGRNIPGKIVIELRHLRACADIMPDWRDLARRALQPNVFYEPDIALAAAQHLVGSESIQAILVWDQPASGGQRHLLGLLPVRIPGPLLPFQQLRGMRSPYFASGVPLVDRECTPEVLGALFRWFGTVDAPGSSYLLPQIDLDGPFAKTLAAAARASGRGLTVIGRHQRGGLIQNVSGTDDALRAALLERLKILRQQLAITGVPAIVEASEGMALRDAVEVFLAMEASGQRGRAGTAMMMQTRTGTFLRAATRGLGKGRHCRMLTLTQGEVPMAVALLYESGARAWLVDLVSDEAFARSLPDEFLMLAVMERQYRHSRVIATEQCGTALPTTLEHLWPERIAIGDILIGPQNSRTPAAVATRAKTSLARRTGLYVRRFVRRLESGT
jgi:Acetyltransferase (GNAT) domain